MTMQKQLKKDTEVNSFDAGLEFVNGTAIIIAISPALTENWLNRNGWDDLTNHLRCGQNYKGDASE